MRVLYTSITLPSRCGGVPPTGAVGAGVGVRELGGAGTGEDRGTGLLLGAGTGDGEGVDDVVRGGSGGGLLVVVGAGAERSERLHVEQRSRLMSLGVLQYGQMICDALMN